MSLSTIQIIIDESSKSLITSAPFAARELAPITVTPSTYVTGTCTLTLIANGIPIAECTLSNGSGTLDLSTTEIIDLFADLPPGYQIPVACDIWNDTDSRLLATSPVLLINNPESSRSSTRVASAGELSITLSGTLTAGLPVMRDDNGKAAACRASNAHRFLGILSTGGTINQSARLVTAGIVTVSSWSLTAGSLYYLSHSADAITATAPTGYNVKPIGRAISTTSLIILPHPTLQTTSSSDPHYLSWDSTNLRYISNLPNQTSAGAIDAGKLIALDSSGKIDSTLLPDQSATISATIAAKLSSLSTLEDPTMADFVTAFNNLLTALK